MAPLHEVCVVYSGVGCGLRSFGPYHPLPPTPHPPPAAGPPPHQLSGQGGRVDGVNEQAGDRARVGPPPYHHPFIPTTPSCHHARPPTPALPAQDGCGEHRPPSHIHTTTHLIYPIAPGGGATALLAPPLTIWPTNTGLYLHKPMQAISLTTPSPAPLYRHKAAERSPTDSASQGYRHSCE